MAVRSAVLAVLVLQGVWGVPFMPKLEVGMSFGSKSDGKASIGGSGGGKFCGGRGFGIGASGGIKKFLGLNSKAGIEMDSKSGGDGGAELDFGTRLKSSFGLGGEAKLDGFGIRSKIGSGKSMNVSGGVDLEGSKGAGLNGGVTLSADNGFEMGSGAELSINKGLEIGGGGEFNASKGVGMGGGAGFGVGKSLGFGGGAEFNASKGFEIGGEFGADREAELETGKDGGINGGANFEAGNDFKISGGAELEGGKRYGSGGKGKFGTGQGLKINSGAEFGLGNGLKFNGDANIERDSGLGFEIGTGVNAGFELKNDATAHRSSTKNHDQPRSENTNDDNNDEKTNNGKVGGSSADGTSSSDSDVENDAYSGTGSKVGADFSSGSSLNFDLPAIPYIGMKTASAAIDGAWQLEKAKLDMLQQGAKGGLDFLVGAGRKMSGGAKVGSSIGGDGSISLGLTDIPSLGAKAAGAVVDGALQLEKAKLDMMRQGAQGGLNLVSGAIPSLNITSEGTGTAGTSSSSIASILQKAMKAVGDKAKSGVDATKNAALELMGRQNGSFRPAFRFNFGGNSGVGGKAGGQQNLNAGLNGETSASSGVGAKMGGGIKSSFKLPSFSFSAGTGTSTNA